MVSYPSSESTIKVSIAPNQTIHSTSRQGESLKGFIAVTIAANEGCAFSSSGSDSVALFRLFRLIIKGHTLGDKPFYVGSVWRLE